MWCECRLYQRMLYVFIAKCIYNILAAVNGDNKTHLE